MRLGRRSTSGSSSRLAPRTASLEAPTAAPPPADRVPSQQNGQHNNQQQQQQPQAAPADPKGFCWTKAWWPVIPLHYLDPKKPMPVTMLGHTYVVWFEPKAQQWRVMEDRCPHRLAPLSEGRIDADGTLMCSYHGEVTHKKQQAC
jgi:pheophorbide a oxygenase